jgi:DNA invertase Pin-like site-specific DNA recombinase/predicted DNA-binding transcriptional regulator AlpA
MNKSELVTAQHLARKAIIYIRQSSPHQVLTNQESLRLQYALQQHALNLGWRPEDIQIIDADLGLTATSTQHREGFKEILTQVTLGHVGIIFSYEVTRLSRNCSDWYPLLDICGYKNCLIADRDGVYDPASPNGRLLLGLKGQLSEMELHTIRARLTAGLPNKAQRGDLALSLPVGLIRDENGNVHKDPNLEVQHRLQLLFDAFLRLKSASKVLRFFNDHDLGIPRHDRFGDLVWKKPTVAAIISILKNPAYAGAFVYGRTRSTRQSSSPIQTSQKRLPIHQWKIRINDKYPAYINWPTFEKIQETLRDNYAEYDRNKTRGIPRPGAALLHGIVYCGECAHKMVVQYKGSTRYLCNYLRHQYGVPVCQYIPADPVDASVVEAFFQALSPVELDSYARAMAGQKKTDEKIDRAHQQHVERLRYQAAFAQRQFSRVDPDNRLVAAELETRWEAALRDLKQAEEAYTQQQAMVIPFVLTAELKAAFTAIGQKLPQIWNKPIVSRQNKKALLRCLIDKVVIHRSARDRVQTRIVWKGGDTTTIEIPIPVGSFVELSSACEMENMILDLSRTGKSDQQIAQQLTALGHRSPLRQTVLPSTVKTVRLKHGLFQKRSQSHPRHITDYLTVPQIAQALHLPKHWIYDRINKGCIQLAKDTKTGLYLFPDEPDTLEMFQKLKDGELYNLRFSEEYQHA